jgi:hypothetical protein
MQHFHAAIGATPDLGFWSPASPMAAPPSPVVSPPVIAHQQMQPMAKAAGLIATPTPQGSMNAAASALFAATDRGVMATLAAKTAPIAKSGVLGVAAAPIASALSISAAKEWDASLQNAAKKTRVIPLNVVFLHRFQDWLKYKLTLNSFLVTAEKVQVACQIVNGIIKRSQIECVEQI